MDDTAVVRPKAVAAARPRQGPSWVMECHRPLPRVRVLPYTRPPLSRARQPAVASAAASAVVASALALASERTAHDAAK